MFLLMCSLFRSKLMARILFAWIIITVQRAATFLLVQPYISGKVIQLLLIFTAELGKSLVVLRLRLKRAKMRNYCV